MSRRMGNEMVVVREHSPSFKIRGEIARDAQQAAVQNIKTLRSVKIMRLKISGPGAASFIATKLLLTWRWRFFWLSLLPTVRLPLSLASTHAAASLLLLLLGLGRRRLSVSALHSFSWDARFTR